MNNPGELLTVDRVAEMIKVSPRTVRMWVSNNKIPSIRIMGSRRFIRSDVEEWIAQQQEEQP